MGDGPTDLMFQDEIRAAVAATYGALPRGAGRAIVGRLYQPAAIVELPQPAVDWSLGVGDPVRHADLQPGEAVLDLGCGGGIDSVLAARRVGSDGWVLGVDVLPEMCARAQLAAEAAGVADRCRFVPGAMEAVPLPDGCVDVVISNGVLNLSPRKSRALAEAARVLRPGGRLCVTDLVIEAELPPEVLGSPAVWAGCIAGAMSEGVLRRKLARAGFIDVRIDHRVPFGIDDLAAYPLFGAEVIELLRRLLPADRLDRIATAVLVRAVMPSAAPSAPERSPELGWASRATHLAEIDPDAVEAPGVAVRHLKRVDDVEFKVLDVDAGGSTPFHTHRHAHEGIVISGTGHLRLADGREPLRPGSVFSVNPTDEHAIECTGDEALRFVCLDCFLR